MSEKYRPLLDDPNVWVPYRYHPSRTAAIVFVAAFSLTTMLHIFQVVRRKTWYFIPLIVGGVFEVVGFIGRILSANDIWSLGPFIMQSLLLLVAPALFAASVYIILGRIILLTDGERHSLVPQKWLTKIFVAGDVLSFLTQGGGGGIQSAGTLELLHTGEKVIIAGLFLQLFFFGLFVIVAGVFHYRLLRSMQAGGHSAFRHIDNSMDINLNQLPWKRHLYALYTASILIMIRSIFRVIEYLQGNNGYLLRREAFLYIFDALLMLTVMVLFNWVHPAEITALYHKRMSERSSLSLEETRNLYLGQEQQVETSATIKQQV